MLEKEDFQILQTMMQETVRKEVQTAVKEEMQTTVRKEIQDAFDAFEVRMDEKIDRKLDEKLDRKLAASESFLLDEIDRSHQSLKHSIEELRQEVREMKGTTHDEKAREDCGTLFQLYHEQQAEIGEIKAAVGI